jgi:hypothetical protein
LGQAAIVSKPDLPTIAVTGKKLPNSLLRRARSATYPHDVLRILNPEKWYKILLLKE